ncbi:Phenylalanine ammonia-lyase [Labeo rohita]|uniref:Phenylalanine ammonia-lyase n=1 Tax=Labeo rohita TaxID=84645 RepID=A0ABQ8M0Z5_LABRO|nr:Phenylalanine ammonia-lyase [Labeo rohita]
MPKPCGLNYLLSSLLLWSAQSILFSHPAQRKTVSPRAAPRARRLSNAHPLTRSSFAVVCQPLRSPLALQLCSGFTPGLPVSNDVMAGGSLVSISSLRVLDSALARRPSGSTMAPNFLLSTVARQSTGSTGLPRPSGSALVWHRPSCASGFVSSHFRPLSLQLHHSLPQRSLGSPRDSLLCPYMVLFLCSFCLTSYSSHLC